MSTLKFLAAVYLTHFGSDESLTAAQKSALADAAVVVEYRCPSCCSCNSCRDEGLEMRSLYEEHEQLLIQSSVSFDPDKGKLTATLPFIKDPSQNIHNNEHVANKILARNWNKLAKKQKERKEVIDSFIKLYSWPLVWPLSRRPTLMMLSRPQSLASSRSWQFKLLMFWLTAAWR